MFHVQLVSMFWTGTCCLQHVSPEEHSCIQQKSWSNTNWSGNLFFISKLFPPQLIFLVLLEGLGAFASRRRFFQLCLQDHLNFNLIYFQKKGPIPPLCFQLCFSAPIFVIVGDCSSPEVPVLADPDGSWGVSLWEKWGCENGREIRAGRWRSGWRVNVTLVREPPPALALAWMAPWEIEDLGIPWGPHCSSVKLVQTELCSASLSAVPKMCLSNSPVPYQARLPHKELWYKQIKKTFEWEEGLNLLIFLFKVYFNLPSMQRLKQLLLFCPLPQVPWTAAPPERVSVRSESGFDTKIPLAPNFLNDAITFWVPAVSYTCVWVMDGKGWSSFVSF